MEIKIIQMQLFTVDRYRLPLPSKGRARGRVINDKN
jgi:hypothetical protein